MPMKNIVLITSRNSRDPYNNLSINLGPMALEAYLSRHSTIRADIIEDIEKVPLYKPEIVGISSVTENYGAAMKMAQKIKEKASIPVIIGGAHISTCPESLHPVFDAGIIGEGEATLLELLTGYPAMEQIAGLIFWKEGALNRTAPRAQIPDLDSLPHPHRAKWIESPGWPIIMTSRGCAYRCRFCSSPAIWGGYRDYSPEYVIEEIKDMISTFRVSHIRFFDDTFTLNRKRLRKIVDMMAAEGIPSEVSFSCFSRINQLDREMMRLLLRGNIRLAIIGIETASDRVLPTLKDRGAGVLRSQLVIDMAYDMGLKLSCTVIIGSPGETERELLETYSFLSQNAEKLYEVEINPLVPLPGTEIWEYAKEKGLVGNDMDWSRLKDYSNLLIFDPEKYIYLNEHIPREKFMGYVTGFRGLFRQFLKPDRELFGNARPGARLREYL